MPLLYDVPFWPSYPNLRKKGAKIPEKSEVLFFLSYLPPLSDFVLLCLKPPSPSIIGHHLCTFPYLKTTITYPYISVFKTFDLYRQDRNYFSHGSFSNTFHSNTKNNFTKNNLIRLGNCFPCLVVVPKFVFTKVSFNISTNYLLSSIQYIFCFQANNFDTTWHSD